MNAEEEISKFDLQQLNEIVSCFYMHSNTISHEEANERLIEYSSNDVFFYNSLNIFYTDQVSIQTKFIAITFLRNSVQQRWNCMLPDFQEQVKSFALSFFFNNPFGDESQFDSLVEEILFSVLNYEWPHHWPSFFAQLINNLDYSKEISIILCLKFIAFLGTEVQSSAVTSVRSFEMARALQAEIPNIFNFIQNVLAKFPTLKTVLAAFASLTVCISWIPVDYFIESQFFCNIFNTFINQNEISFDLAEETIPFLTQLVVSLNLTPDKQNLISQIFNILMILTTGTNHCNNDNNNVFHKNENEINRCCCNISNINNNNNNNNNNITTNNINNNINNNCNMKKIRLTKPASFVNAIKTCFEYYGNVIEEPKHVNQLKNAMSIIMAITIESNDDNVELLETCFSFWVGICQRLLIDRSPITTSIYLPFTAPLLDVLLAKIPCPYHVGYNIDEFGIEHRQLQLSLLYSELYSHVRQCINFLTNLNEVSVIEFFTMKINELKKDGVIFLTADNEKVALMQRICWMIYSTSGVISENEEDKSFLLIMKSLFATFFSSPINESSLIIFVNIIFTVAQFNRFLKKFPDVLKNLTHVIYDVLLFTAHDNNKYGVEQCVVIHSLRTIANRCKSAMLQLGLFNDLLAIFNVLKTEMCEDGLIELYGVYGILTKELPDNQKEKEEVLNMLLALPQIVDVTDVNANRQLFVALECHCQLQKFNMNNYYIEFVKHSNLINLFQLYSNFLNCNNINNANNNNNNNNNSNNNVSEVTLSVYMAKSIIVELISQFVRYCFQPSYVSGYIIPTFCELFLSDFINSPYDHRALHTLSFAQSVLMRGDMISPSTSAGVNGSPSSSALSKQHGVLSKGNNTSPSMREEEYIMKIGSIFEPIFNSTYSMISTNFDDYQDYRLPFYGFITAIIHKHYAFLMSLNASDLDKVIQVIEYGCNHPLPAVSQLSFDLLTDFVSNLKETTRFQELFTRYAVELVKFSFVMLSNASFKMVFKEQVSLVRSLFAYQDIAAFCPKIVEVLLQLFPGIKPTDLIELVKSLAECGAYLEGIRILLKDFVLSLGQISPFDADLMAVEKGQIVGFIHASFDEVQDEFEEVEDHLSQGIRSITIQNQ